TEQERHDFLPEPLYSELSSLSERCERVDPAAISNAEFQRLLADTNPEVVITCWKTPPIPAVPPPNLRYVCHLTGSIKNLVTREQIERGLIASNWGGSISRIVAEAALYHILSCLRRATFWTLAMHRERGWKTGATETASLFGRRVGLHGFGQIARELTRILRPFGCEITAFAPDVDASVEARYHVTASPSLDALFSDNEIVVELAPLVPSTIGVVTERLLRLIKPGGVFVNVGRGAVVDEAALLRVAREGTLNVGLDVFAVEPLPVDSGFRGLSNVTLTPHLAGPTTDRRRDAGEFAIANVRAYASGQAIEARITAATYDLRA
ncbi:MAG: hydroxyacid dehydrogenase, partial [Opitutus sp.]